MASSLDHRHTVLDLIKKTPAPVRQGILGFSYLFVPRRLPGLLPLAAVTIRDLPKIGAPLIPDPAHASDQPDGLCGLAGKIGVPDLLAGYKRGMFTMSHIGPLKWWAPKHRMVLFFDQARIEKTTRRLLRRCRFQITLDTAFAEVMQACARPRSDGLPLTWITPRVQALFEQAHDMGHAHSVEVWENDQLVGGAYGLSVGRAFDTESQFHTVRDASKVGFAVLNRHLQTWGFAFNDCKHPTRYLADSGSIPVTRPEFSGLCRTYGAMPGRVGKWAVDSRLTDDQWEPASAPGYCMEEVLPGGTKCQWSIDDLLSSQRSGTW